MAKLHDSRLVDIGSTWALNAALQHVFQLIEMVGVFSGYGVAIALDWSLLDDSNEN